MYTLLLLILTLSKIRRYYSKIRKYEINISFLLVTFICQLRPERKKKDPKKIKPLQLFTKKI